MKKYYHRIISILLIASMLSVLSGCGYSASKPVVRLSLWGGEWDQDMLTEMSDEFAKYYADQADIQVTVCVESESTCSDTVCFAPEYAADVYAFPDDQLKVLCDNNALMPVAEEYCSELISENGGESSVAVLAATYDDSLYAYPMTASNGYFLYYNAEYIDDSAAESFEAMLEAAAANDKKVAMELTSGWYLYSFFKSAGMDITIDEETGKNICDFNSKTNTPTGVEISDKISDIAAHKGFINADNDKLVEGVEDGSIIAAVSGTWNEKLFKEYYGDSYRAAKLPAFTVNDKTMQMHSIMGYKLFGVNAYSKEAEWASKLAIWLTNEENQLRRFRERGEGPTNINVAKMDEIQKSAAIAALSAQSEFGHLQRVNSNYWEPMYQFGISISSQIYDSSEMQGILDDTVQKIVAE